MNSPSDPGRTSPGRADPRRPWHRPMRGWWQRNPYYLRYLAMEATSILIALYALILLLGLWRLAQGETAYEAWQSMLRSPLSIAFHVLLLPVFAFHSYSWFRIMPKTLPAIEWRGRRLAQATITRIGIAAALLVNLALILLFAGVQP
jgi:fumarate reductase subunit C